MRVRNYLYNIGYKRSFEFDAKVIGVGNLSVGGTGKTPMIEYLIRLIGESERITTLSRGYRRKTRGFKIGTARDNHKTIGDEPYQFMRKFKKIHVTVGEERAVAIPFILAELPNTEIILLDDAYQHRPVKPSINILLTNYNRPFYSDFVLPSGRLREARKGAQRADLIVVTKCPNSLKENTIEQMESCIRKFNSTASISFAAIKYAEVKPVWDGHVITKDAFLFSGIASSELFNEYAQTHFQVRDSLNFSDHNDYTEADYEKIEKAFSASGAGSLLTTEKDMVKLLSSISSSVIRGLPVFYLPIEIAFIHNGKKFDETVLKLANSPSS